LALNHDGFVPALGRGVLRHHHVPRGDFIPVPRTVALALG
jgi:hypothetical protein